MDFTPAGRAGLAPATDSGLNHGFAVRPVGCLPVAESGRFRRLIKPAGKPESAYEDREVRFVSPSARVTDEEYDLRTRVEPGPKAVTIDARRKQ